MSAAKGGRKVVKANRAARSKPGTKTLLRPSASPLADEIAMLRSQLDAVMEHGMKLYAALWTLIPMYDRAAGNLPHGNSWSVAETLQLAKIRELAYTITILDIGKPAGAQTPLISYGKSSKPENPPQIGS